MRKWHLVCYDIRDDTRLRKAAQIVSGYGDRLQYSVFRCRLSATELERLLWELGRVLKPEDSLLLIPLCQRCVEGVRSRNRGDAWGEPDRFRVV